MIIKKSSKKIKNSSATVTFDLTNEIDASNLNRIIKLSKVYDCLRDIAEDLRARAKNSNCRIGWSDAKEVFWKHLSESGIDPYED
jgi:hypothetical protein